MVNSWFYLESTGVRYMYAQSFNMILAYVPRGTRSKAVLYTCFCGSSPTCSETVSRQSLRLRFLMVISTDAPTKFSTFESRSLSR